ncbi:hypothetical protein OBV_38670 [Oscillibacter valericigenes Sjm18-20]|nr:hypothetical protein OBV_38670 [Oscillibacter valericigenes Sjm18-20]
MGRVARSTCPKINKEIRDRTSARLNFYQGRGKQALTERITELNREWDTERVLETNAASVVLASSLVGYKKSKCCCFLITGTVGFFFLQHALQGWCPPLPVIRKLGVRTAEEISREKTVIKLMRGDFSHHVKCAEDILKAAQKN